MVLFDNNILCLLLHPDADVPNDPVTGKPIEQAYERVDYLRQRLEELGVRILIPAPVLSEFLTFADAEYLQQINQTMWFEVGPFEQRAAIEAAIALKRALRSGAGKKLGIASPWQKIKVDRQIVAIGKVYGVHHVFTTDTDVLTIARESGLEATHAADLPLPPVEEVQLSLADLAAADPAAPRTADAKEPPEPAKAPAFGIQDTGTVNPPQRSGSPNRPMRSSRPDRQS